MPELDSETSIVQQNDDTFSTIWEELSWRGLVQVSTDARRLDELLSGPPVTYYCGFDPTAPSLHLGNLVQLLLMRRLQLAGHRALGLVGGSTGLIGDPRPTAERTLNDAATVSAWVDRLRSQIMRFLDFSGDNPATMVNNLDWTAPLSAIDFLRDVGKHFRVGTMLKKDAVDTRLKSDSGISFTEFSYQILQGLDYLELYRTYGCVLQTGGSDQWGNLLSGTDLIHKTEGVAVHAIGTPLITNSDGSKFGKSEGNAVWLDSSMTSPYAFYQFWLNTSDADVMSRLKIFTFFSRDAIEQFERAVEHEPFRRVAQRALARHVTATVHGLEVADKVIATAEALFGAGDLHAADAETIDDALRELPHTSAAPDVTVVQLLMETRLAASRSEARRAIEQGGIAINKVVVHDAAATLGEAMAAASAEPHQRAAVLRRGKKTLAGIFLV